MKLIINGKIVLNDIKVASDFCSKLKGIIWTNLPVLLTKTNSIHSFFVKRNLDIFFIDKNGFIIKKFIDFKPNKIIFPIKDAHSVLEIYTDMGKSDKINVGDKIEYEE